MVNQMENMNKALSKYEIRMYLEMPVELFFMMVLLFYLLVFLNLAASGSTFKLPDDTQANFFFQQGKLRCIPQQVLDKILGFQITVPCARCLGI